VVRTSQLRSYAAKLQAGQARAQGVESHDPSCDIHSADAVRLLAGGAEGRMLWSRPGGGWNLGMQAAAAGDGVLRWHFGRNGAPRTVRRPDRVQAPRLLPLSAPGSGQSYFRRSRRSIRVIT